jgi:cyclase
MPFGYGGGINSIDQIEKIIKCGSEKAIINSAFFLKKNIVSDAVNRFGSSTVVVSIDVKKDLFRGYQVYVKGGTLSTGKDPVEYAKIAESEGAGEIFLNSIDRDGTMQGYDLDLIRKVAKAVRIPVIACGGAGKLDDFRSAIREAEASAAAAGSFFVFHGKRRAVLITYPSYAEISNLFD